jgi:hypothetical protein
VGADKNLSQLGPERDSHDLYDYSEDEGARNLLPLQELQGGGARLGNFPRDDTLMGDRQRARSDRRRLYWPPSYGKEVDVTGVDERLPKGDEAPRVGVRRRKSRSASSG